MPRRSVWLCFIITGVLCILFACQSIPEDEKGKCKVVSTIFPSYDFVREVAGDNVSSHMLLKPGVEIHTYEPTPQDIMRIKECDVLICSGGESEQWLRRILESFDTSSIRVVSLIELVPTLEEDGDGKEADEHVWTSPRNSAVIAEEIARVLKEEDPGNEKEYSENIKKYITKLKKLDRSFQNIVDTALRDTIVIGDRFSFRYFVDAYGLNYRAAFPGCVTESEASAATISELIGFIKEADIPAVFSIELSNRKMADAIAEATETEVLLFHSCHNVSVEEFTSGETYLTLMEKNALNIKKALLK